MISISQSESVHIRKNSPTTHIMITSKRKRSGGKNYFMEESPAAMKLLKQLRESQYKIVKDDRK
jgi:hypothetical protein